MHSYPNTQGTAQCSAWQEVTPGLGQKLREGRRGCQKQEGLTWGPGPVLAASSVLGLMSREDEPLTACGRGRSCEQGLGDSVP